MSEKNIASAVAYYQAMGNKDISSIEQYLHPDVVLISPLAVVTGKDAVLNSVKHFFAVFNKLTIRTQFATEDQAMVVYDLDCSAPIGAFKGAALLTFKDDLIIGYELFYDARPFDKKRDEIFT
jgi:ketosteroid isomerase-like protein